MLTDSTTVAASDLVLIDFYKEYHLTGAVRLIGGLNDGLKSGVFREYDEQGNIVNGYIYKQDTLLSEGMILFDGTYRGEWKNYYNTGQIRETGTYINGLLDGKWVYYYPSGKKEQEGEYKNNLPFGVWIWYYPNGKIQRRESYNGYGKLEGTVTEYDSLGTEIARGEYYNDLQEGPWFYFVGDHKEIGSFTIGKPDGVWNYYYHNGTLAFTGAFDEGEPKGKHIYYHQNGIKKELGKYVGGTKDGNWRVFNTAGEEIEEIQYKNGEIYKINGFKVEPTEQNGSQ